MLEWIESAIELKLDVEKDIMNISCGKLEHCTQMPIAVLICKQHNRQI